MLQETVHYRREGEAARPQRGAGDALAAADRGTLLTSADYRQFLDDNHLVCSVRAVGHCADNAAAEGFFGMLKCERVDRRRHLTHAHACSDAFDYIEVFNNRSCRPSHLGGNSPEAFEKQAAA